MKKKLFLFFIFIINFNILAEDYKVLDRIVATVEKDVVTETEIEKQIYLKYREIDLNNLSSLELQKIKKEVLENLIEKKLIIQYAELLNLSPSQEEVDLVIQNILLNNNITLEILEKDLIEQNTNLLNFKDEIKTQICVQKIKDREIMPYVNISKYEIDAWLKQNSYEKKEYKISHILLKTENSNYEKVISSIKQDQSEENFSDLARNYSDGPNADNFGDLGWNKINDLPEIFKDFILSAKVGDISNKISSKNGIHILRLNSIKGISEKKLFLRQYKFQQILLKTNSITSDDEIEKKLNNIKNLIIDGLDFTEALRLYSEDQSNFDSNNLVWINYDNLVPDFKKNINLYPEKNIIGPFKTDLGWHLVKVYDYREADVTLENEFQEAKIQIAKRKTEIRYQDWLNMLKKNSKIKFFEI